MKEKKASVLCSVHMPPRMQTQQWTVLNKRTGMGTSTMESEYSLLK